MKPYCKVFYVILWILTDVSTYALLLERTPRLKSKISLLKFHRKLQHTGLEECEGEETQNFHFCVNYPCNLVYVFDIVFLSSLRHVCTVIYTSL